MPYRAMLFSVLMVIVALSGVGLWMRAVAPVVRDVDAAATQEPPYTHRKVTFPDQQGETSVDFSRKLHRVVPGTVLLSLLLIGLVLIVGFAATFREWVRYNTRRRVANRERTPYVDAWKLAGERAKPSEEEHDE